MVIYHQNTTFQKTHSVNLQPPKCWVSSAWTITVKNSRKPNSWSWTRRTRQIFGTGWKFLMRVCWNKVLSRTALNRCFCWPTVCRIWIHRGVTNIQCVQKFWSGSEIWSFLEIYRIFFSKNDQISEPDQNFWTHCTLDVFKNKHFSQRLMPSVTTFGFGKSLDTDLMVNLANWTGGRFVYRVIFKKIPCFGQKFTF